MRNCLPVQIGVVENRLKLFAECGELIDLLV
jgi:hypothetical protein